jgi:hypothetical protein
MNAFFSELLPTNKEKEEEEGFCLRILVIRHRRSIKKRNRKSGEKKKSEHKE